MARVAGVAARASTSRSYAAHVRGYLVPYLGGIPLAALTAGDVQAIFTAVIRDENAGRRVIALDKTTIAALREHKLRQQAERGAAGTRWTRTDAADTVRHPCWAAVHSDALPVACFLVTLDTADLAPEAWLGRTG